MAADVTQTSCPFWDCVMQSEECLQAQRESEQLSVEVTALGSTAFGQQQLEHLLGQFLSEFEN
jgi:hypothetical protein